MDGKKLPKHSSSSEPRHLVHGSELTVGDTKFLCHIHDGMETCNLCEPGIQAPPPEEGMFILSSFILLLLFHFVLWVENVFFFFKLKVNIMNPLEMLYKN